MLISSFFIYYLMGRIVFSCSDPLDCIYTEKKTITTTTKIETTSTPTTTIFFQTTTTTIITNTQKIMEKVYSQIQPALDEHKNTFNIIFENGIFIVLAVFLVLILKLVLFIKKYLF
jgi:hypothetical protein